MDAISLVMALFLNLNEPCTALPAEESMIGGQDYRILRYDCGAKRFRIAQRLCREGRGFWGRPFLLQEEASQQGLYVNRFGEVMAGWHVAFDDVYFPACGS
jgi:hypothetical protein